MPARDIHFAIRVNEVEATVRHHLDALGADLRRTYGVGKEGMAVLVCDALETYLADPAPASAEIESAAPQR